jgi:hypothetical protein
MTVTFGDGATVETALFGDGSPGGSQAVADATVAPAPTIDVEGVSLSSTTLSPDHTAATVSDASQTVTVTGEPGTSVTLLRVEGELSLAGVPDYDGTPGYDVEAYEANTAVQVEEYTATVGPDGTAEVPVTLTNSSADGGLNHLVASVSDSEGETGLTSNVVVLRYDETGTSVAEAVASHGSGDDAVVDTQEIQTAINWWATGTEVPGTGGETITTQQIQQLVNLWATGTPVDDGGTQTQSLIAGVLGS